VTLLASVDVLRSAWSLSLSLSRSPLLPFLAGFVGCFLILVFLIGSSPLELDYSIVIGLTFAGINNDVRDSRSAQSRARF